MSDKDKNPTEEPTPLLKAIRYARENVWPKNPAAVALGKLGGASKSTAKQRASKKNGRKGGRPKKAASLVSGEPATQKEQR